MKDQYGWHLPLTDKEIKEVWESGVLTVDTNVLLDLYRYHENTRNSLLESIASFDDRVWLSHQAATEFFRNRKKVIATSSEGFKQAAEEIAKLQKNVQGSISQLAGNRIIPGELIAKLQESIASAANEALKQIASVKDGFPNFLVLDPILDKLLNIFDGAVGDDFDEQEKDAINKEAEHRKKNKIPPGYMDKGKDDDRPYGDFYLWMQVLGYAKKEGRPIILVTSERKEDWWEEHYGKLVGPRSELLKDANDLAGQKVLIYQTARFIEYASVQRGNKVDQSVFEEIKAIGQAREKAGPAVNILSQDVFFSTSDENNGFLVVELARHVTNFTATGHFSPNLDGIPQVDVKIVDVPSDTPTLQVYASTGTDYDFNVHVRSIEKGVSLPAGIYVFEYEAAVLGELVESIMDDADAD